jgi:sporulation protein YlmC with PRC-barrel domain
MTTRGLTPAGLRRPVLAAAIALLICSPGYAADQPPPRGQYQSAVAYGDYQNQHGDYKLRASELIGRSIRNANNDEIGEIDDLIVSQDGDKVMAVLSLGAFVNLGSKLVAIPYEELRVTKDGKYVYYNATKDELQRRTGWFRLRRRRPSWRV